MASRESQEARRLAQTALAEANDTTQETISTVERGNQYPLNLKVRQDQNDGWRLWRDTPLPAIQMPLPSKKGLAFTRVGPD